MTPPTAVLSALPLAGTVKKHIKSRDGSHFSCFFAIQFSHFVSGKITHIKVLLDLGDEVTVERYMVVPPAPKMIGAFNVPVKSVGMNDSVVFLRCVPYKICSISNLCNVSFLICQLHLGTGTGAFEGSQVLENQRHRTSVNRTQNISHANMSDRAFERMCETGEVPDLDSRPKKRRASKEDSGKKGKKYVTEEVDDDDDDDDDNEEEQEEQDVPKRDRKSRHSSNGQNDLKTPSKVKGSATKRSHESNGDGDSDVDDDAIEVRNTPSSSRRSRGK